MLAVQPLTQIVLWSVEAVTAGFRGMVSAAAVPAVRIAPIRRPIRNAISSDHPPHHFDI